MVSITWFDVDRFIAVLKSKGLYIRRYNHPFRISILVHGKFSVDVLDEYIGASSAYEGYMTISFSEFEGGSIGVHVDSCDYYNRKCIRDDKLSFSISGIHKDFAEMDTVFNILNVVIDGRRLSIRLQK